MEIYKKDIIITGSQDTTAKTWSFETGECLKTFRGHTGAVLCLATDSLGKILFTGSSDNTIRAWDIYRGTELHVYDQHQAAIINLLVGERNIRRRKLNSPCFSALINYFSRSVLIIQQDVGWQMWVIVQEYTKDIDILFLAFKLIMVSVCLLNN